jgi:Holliday junction resolvase RusA-like endonuclease
MGQAMNSWSLLYYGPFMGAVRMTQRSKWTDPRAQQYAACKRALRLAANTVGIPTDLDPKKSYSVDILVTFEKKARYDCDNLAKFVLDALWTQDRRVLSLSIDVEERRKCEFVEVNVSEIQ